MNSYTSSQRHYRILEASSKDEQKFQVIVEETDLLITVPSYISIEQVVDLSIGYIHKLRQGIKKYIQTNPEFLNSLTPVLPRTNSILRQG